MLCAADLMEPWTDTPGAVVWLRKEVARTRRR